MNKSPKISFIITYNSENNLSDCLNTIINQSFSDIEIICVNKTDDDNSHQLLQDIIENEAKSIGLGIASGEFVYFINGNEILPDNFVQNICSEISSLSGLEIKENYLYRRMFLENDKEIASLIQDKINNEKIKIADLFEEEKQKIKDEFENLYKNNTENIKNSTYDIICRFNQLEKLFWEKDFEYKTLIQNENSNYFEQNIKKNIEFEFSKVYDYINAEINKKGTDINNLYAEITKNYDYTERIIKEKGNELLETQNRDKDSLINRLQELEKEIVIRYVNIKRLLDMEKDEVTLKFNQIGLSNTDENNTVSLNETLSVNIENIYSQLNKISAVFYEELSKIYKDCNEKLNERNLKEKNNLEYQISELRSEFDRKLQELKNEIVK